jgi:hypothetical protein
VTKEEKEIWKQTWAVFDRLDEAGKVVIASIFLSTPEVGKDSEYHKEFKRRGYAKLEGRS